MSDQQDLTISQPTVLVGNGAETVISGPMPGIPQELDYLVSPGDVVSATPIVEPPSATPVNFDDGVNYAG